MRKRVIKFIVGKIRWIIEIIMLIIAVYLIKEGYFIVEVLIRALIIMSLMLVYKWLGHKVGISRGYLENTNIGRLGIIPEWENKEKIEWEMKRFVLNKWCVRYPIILDIVFWGFRMIPWNWPRNIVMWIYTKIFNMIVRISSNIDIYKEKRGKESKYKIKEWKYWYVVKWVIIYPIMRMLYFPWKIRTQIFGYRKYSELIRIRIFIYIYSMMGIYMGIYEYINVLDWKYKLIIIYFFFAVWWPIIIRLQGKMFKFREDAFYEPEFSSLVTIFYLESITLSLFYVFLEIIGSVKAAYLQIKYFYCNECCKSIYKKFSRNNLEFYVFWNYVLNGEKLYGVSSFAYGVVWKLVNSINLIDRELALYKEGKKELGEKYMRKYEEEIERIGNLYKCRQLLMMDMRRLMGYERKEWLLHYNSYFKRESKKILDEIFLEDVKRNKAILKKKRKYKISLKLYNKLYKNAILLCGMQSSIKAIGFGTKGSKDLVYELAKRKGFNVIEPTNVEEESQCYWEKQKYLDYFYKEKGYAEVEEESLYDFEYIDKLNEEVKEIYNKEYEELREEEELISEKYINEYIEKNVYK